MFQISEGVTGQKPDKVSYMTRQIDRNFYDLVSAVGIDPLEFPINTLH